MVDVTKIESQYIGEVNGNGIPTAENLGTAIMAATLAKAAYGNQYTGTTNVSPPAASPVARNLTEAHPDLHRRYAVMLDIIFPNSARSRLSSPPSEIEEVQPVE